MRVCMPYQMRRSLPLSFSPSHRLDLTLESHLHALDSLQIPLYTATGVTGEYVHTYIRSPAAVFEIVSAG